MLVVTVSIGELNGTGSPGATGSGMKCYMVAAGRMVDGLARAGAEVSSVSSPRNANAGTLDGPGLHPLITIVTYLNAQSWDLHFNFVDCMDKGAGCNNVEPSCLLL